MKRLILLFFVTVTISGNAVASTFVSQQALKFGKLLLTSTSGAVTVSLNSSINTGAGATSVGAAYGAGVARYTGTGLSSVLELLTTTVVTPTVTLTNGSGGTATVSNFTTTPGLYIGLASPTKDVNIGGQLNFTAATTPGDYTGTVQIQGSSLLSGSAAVTVPITLTVLRPITVSQTTQMDFGVLEKLSGPAVVRLAAANGARTLVSGTGVNIVANPPGSAGVFAITGSPNQSLTVSLPNSATLTGPGTAMTVNNFNAVSGAEHHTIPANGNLTLRVGADLNVNATQTAGVYSGTYQITVNY